MKKFTGIIGCESAFAGITAAGASEPAGIGRFYIYVMNVRVRMNRKEIGAGCLFPVCGGEIGAAGQDGSGYGHEE